MLDVRQNFKNPFFTETITVISRSQSINQYGETALTETSTASIASVQPTQGKELQFLPDFALETETVTIYCPIELHSQAHGGYSDVVIHNGNRYQIIKAQVWKTHTVAIGMLEALSE